MQEKGSQAHNYFEVPLNDPKNEGRIVIEGAIGKITGLEVLKGGLVHRIYAVDGEEMSGILKIRGNRFAMLPDIPMNPSNIKYEFRALLLLSSLYPNLFPHVLAYSESQNFILMTDIFPSRRTLEDDLEDKTVDPEFIFRLGTDAARVHRKLQSFRGRWREVDEKEAFQQDVYYRLGYHNDPILNQVTEELNKMPTQLILSDLSPKNIGKGIREDTKICDLDSFYVGNLEYALSFLPAHLLLHNLNDYSIAYLLVEKVISGFRQEISGIDFDSLLFKRLMIGGMLYRLKNDVIPYNLSLSKDEKNNKVEIAFQLLKSDNLSWEELIKSLTSKK